MCWKEIVVSLLNYQTLKLEKSVIRRSQRWRWSTQAARHVSVESSFLWAFQSPSLHTTHPPSPLCRATSPTPSTNLLHTPSRLPNHTNHRTKDPHPQTRQGTSSPHRDEPYYTRRTRIEICRTQISVPPLHSPSRAATQPLVRHTYSNPVVSFPYLLNHHYVSAEGFFSSLPPRSNYSLCSHSKGLKCYTPEIPRPRNEEPQEKPAKDQPKPHAYSLSLAQICSLQIERNLFAN
jgi:hypothetical protein